MEKYMNKYYEVVLNSIVIQTIVILR